MKKFTAENCREQFEQWFRDVEAGDDDNWSPPEYLSREWHDYIARRQLALGAWNKALEIALAVSELNLPDEASEEDIPFASSVWNACLDEVKRLNRVEK